MKPFLTIAFVAGLSGLLAACTSAPMETAEAKPDPRQGAEVSSICFQSQIKSWKENDDKSVIVVMENRDEFKLDLIGACRPDDAFLSVGLRSDVGSGCLLSGSTLRTDAGDTKASCSIRRIYKWMPEAGQAAAGGASSGG